MIAGHPGIDLPAITTRAAPADILCLEHNHAAPGLGQLQRRRQAGKTGADNTDIRIQHTLQLCAGRNGGHAGPIPGIVHHKGSRITNNPAGGRDCDWPRRGQTVCRYHMYSRSEMVFSNSSISLSLQSTNTSRYSSPIYSFITSEASSSRSASRRLVGSDGSC